MQVADSLLDLVGHTPLVRLRRVGADLPCDLIAKGVGKIPPDPTFCDTFHATDETFYKSIAFWKVPISNCGYTQAYTCVAYPAWLSNWTTIKG